MVYYTGLTPTPYLRMLQCNLLPCNQAQISITPAIWMFTGPAFVSTLEQLHITHFIWIPDATFGPCESALESSNAFRLIRVCREGEAWPLAAGLIIGGARPIVAMQITGFFESGDAYRNAVHDLKLPIFSLIGMRNWLTENSTDTARQFGLPIIEAWGIDYVWVESAGDAARLGEHYHKCRVDKKPGAALIAEGRG